MKIKDRCSSINKGTEILSSSNNVGNMVALVSDTLRLVRNITLCLTHSVSMSPSFPFTSSSSISERVGLSHPVAG